MTLCCSSINIADYKPCDLLPKLIPGKKTSEAGDIRVLLHISNRYIHQIFFVSLYILIEVFKVLIIRLLARSIHCMCKHNRH